MQVRTLQSAENSLVEQFKKWLSAAESPENLNLLISGKTGVGKYRLVNALVGIQLAPEGRDEVTSYECNIEGVPVTVWNSPGLQDETTNEDEYIQDMKDKIKDVTLMIYCVRMDDTRFYEADKNAIRTLTDVFGKEVWKHAVVALTFANKVEDPDGEDELKYFQSQLKEWEKQIKEYFTNSVGIDVGIVIPVIPVGNKVKSPRLPDRENWLSDLWIECYHVMKTSARLGMYRINRQRLMNDDSTARAESSDNKDEFSAPIFLNDKQQDKFSSSTWESFLSFAWETLLSHELEKLAQFVPPIGNLMWVRLALQVTPPLLRLLEKRYKQSGEASTAKPKPKDFAGN